MPFIRLLSLPLPLQLRLPCPAAFPPSDLDGRLPHSLLSTKSELRRLNYKEHAVVGRDVSQRLHAWSSAHGEVRRCSSDKRHEHGYGLVLCSLAVLHAGLSPSPNPSLRTVPDERSSWARYLEMNLLPSSLAPAGSARSASLFFPFLVDHAKLLASSLPRRRKAADVLLHMMELCYVRCGDVCM
uniref:Uncharacterized protein n=1 Tax=Arundo donax TaxID=35708 RepID=A0A0A9GVJ7_ARUDO